MTQLAAATSTPNDYLSQLPVEMDCHIMGYLDADSLGALMCADKHFYTQVQKWVAQTACPHEWHSLEQQYGTSFQTAHKIHNYLCRFSLGTASNHNSGEAFSEEIRKRHTQQDEPRPPIFTTEQFPWKCLPLGHLSLSHESAEDKPATTAQCGNFFAFPFVGSWTGEGIQELFRIDGNVLQPLPLKDFPGLAALNAFAREQRKSPVHLVKTVGRQLYIRYQNGSIDLFDFDRPDVFLALREPQPSHSLFQLSTSNSEGKGWMTQDVTNGDPIPVFVWVSADGIITRTPLRFLKSGLADHCKYVKVHKGRLYIAAVNGFVISITLNTKQSSCDMDSTIQTSGHVKLPVKCMEIVEDYVVLLHNDKSGQGLSIRTGSTEKVLYFPIETSGDSSVSQLIKAGDGNERYLLLVMTDGSVYSLNLSKAAASSSAEGNFKQMIASSEWPATSFLPVCLSHQDLVFALLGTRKLIVYSLSTQERIGEIDLPQTVQPGEQASQLASFDTATTAYSLNRVGDGRLCIAATLPTETVYLSLEFPSRACLSGLSLANPQPASASGKEEVRDLSFLPLVEPPPGLLVKIQTEGDLNSLPSNEMAVEPPQGREAAPSTSLANLNFHESLST